MKSPLRTYRRGIALPSRHLRLIPYSQFGYDAAIFSARLFEGASMVPAPRNTKAL
ncbi:MAG: hypothetical protein ACLRSW_05565 [Christensenellaceae bacterium]